MSSHTIMLAQKLSAVGSRGQLEEDWKAALSKIKPGLSVEEMRPLTDVLHPDDLVSSLKVVPDCIKTCSGVQFTPFCPVCRWFNSVLILWISMIFMCSSYPVVSSMSSNPFYLNCQLYGKSDSCLVLLNNCLAKAGRSEEVAVLKPHLKMPFNKRSFRNGVGSGIKKTSSRRAKS